MFDRCLPAIARSALMVPLALAVILPGLMIVSPQPAAAQALRFDFDLGWEDPPPRRWRPLPPLMPPRFDEQDDTELYADLPPPNRRMRHRLRQRLEHMRARQIVRVPYGAPHWQSYPEDDDVSDDVLDNADGNGEVYASIPDEPAPVNSYGGYPQADSQPPIYAEPLHEPEVLPQYVPRPAPLPRRTVVVTPPATKYTAPKPVPARPLAAKPKPKPQVFAKQVPPALIAPLPPKATKPAAVPPATARNCPKGTEIEKRLIADGWTGFAEPEKRTSTVLMTAKRDGVAYRLTLDRCTGVVLSAKLLSNKQAAN